MFSNTVSQLPLTDAAASVFFSNINADDFEGDVTFCATLRALLYNRLRYDESVNVKLDIRNNEEVNQVVGITAGIPGIVPSAQSLTGSLFIRVIKGLTALEMETALNNAKHILASFKLLKDVSLYISQTGIKAYAYINEDTKQTLIFMSGMNKKCWHKMQSAITKLMPWYFTTPPDELETELLHSLTDKDSRRYTDIISEYAKRFNFREDWIKKLLKDFNSSFERQRYKFLLEERERNSSEFMRLQEETAKCIARERELLSDITGLKIIIEQGEGMGMADYFICNKSLRLISTDNDKLTYVVTTYLEYFDQQVFEKCFKNPNSYFYNHISGLSIEHEQYKRLLSAIYGYDACIRVRTCAAFTLSLSGVFSPLAHSIHLDDRT